MNNSNYEVIEKIEILNEMCVEALSKIYHYMIDKNISNADKTNPMTILYSYITRIKNDIYSSEYSSVDDLKMIEGFLLYIIKYLNEVDSNE